MITFIDETGAISEPRVGDATTAALYNADLNEQGLEQHGHWIVLSEAEENSWWRDAKEFKL